MVCPFFEDEFGQLSKPLDELDDDALSDGGEEEMTIEQQGLPEANMLASVHAEYAQAQMNDGLEQVRLVIGNEVTSELSDNSIKDALWEYYFDIERTVQWALGL
jgi:HBS1 N-terminus